MNPAAPAAGRGHDWKRFHQRWYLGALPIAICLCLPAVGGAQSAPPKPEKPEITTFQQLKGWVSTRVLSDGGSSITKWEYQLKADEGDFGSWKSVVATDRQIVFAIPGLSKGVTYQVKTRATNAVGTGPASDASESKTYPATKPDTPGKPSVSGADASVTLNWTPGDDGGAGLTQWEYAMKEGSGNYGGWTRICRTTDDATCPNRTSHTVSDLTNGTAYTFKVRSTNGVGPSNDSPESDSVTPSTTHAHKGHTPVDRRPIDYGRTTHARFRERLFRVLRGHANLAVRLGDVRRGRDRSWILKARPQDKLLGGELRAEDLTDADFVPALRQKGVDMRIGLDIASITLKRQAGVIVLVSGDADFVPAVKLARREGVQFVLDPLGQAVSTDLREHVDGLHCVLPKPHGNTTATA